MVIQTLFVEIVSEDVGNVALHPSTAIQTLGVEIACESEYSSQVATAVSNVTLHPSCYRC